MPLTSPVCSTDPKPEVTAASKFGTLEFGRGIAALLVVLDHAGYLVAEDRYFGRQAFHGVLINLHVGVDFFFVLSGFIIATVHWGDGGRPDRLKRYGGRRFMRIIPPYWVILTLVVATYVLFPQFGVERQHEWPNVLASYLLFPMPEQPVLGVAWTLVFEATFYVLFAGYIFVGRRLLYLFIPWIAAILFVALSGPVGYPLDYLTSPYHLEFAAGVLVAWGARRMTQTRPGPLLALLGLGVLVFASCAVAMGPASVLETPLVGRTVFGLASAAIILSAARLEALGRLRVPPLLQILGTMSYSLYLSHVVSESLFIRFAMKLPAAIRTPESVALVIALAGVVGGWAYWRLVERPLLDQFHRGRSRPRARLDLVSDLGDGAARLPVGHDPGVGPQRQSSIGLVE